MAPSRRSHPATVVATTTLVLGALAIGCSVERPPPTDAPDAAPPAPAPALDPPVEVVAVDVPGDLPTFFLRGARGTRTRMIFLHGRCGHAQGYVQSFAFAAAKRGAVVAPQGDVDCGGGLRRWTLDAERQDRRIEAAFRAAGEVGPLTDLVVIGYSQGEVLAERLVAAFPDRYTRAVLMGAPHVPRLERLASVRAVAMVSGEFDAKAFMQEGDRRARAAGLESRYFENRGARHAEIRDAEAFLDEVLGWTLGRPPPSGDGGSEPARSDGRASPTATR